LAAIRLRPGGRSARISALLYPSTDPVKLLSVVEALTKLVPETEHKSRGEDPREYMWRTYLEMRRRGELAASHLSPQQRLEAARAKVAEIEAELAALAPLPDEPLSTPPAPTAPAGNVVPLREPPKPAPPATGIITDNVGSEPWRQFCTDMDGVPLSTRGKYWGPV
jgi:hypothetical protein